ncbi:hypothetical protein KIPB_008834, partial [Kipferlia bialata]
DKSRFDPLLSFCCFFMLCTEFCKDLTWYIASWEIGCPLMGAIDFAFNATTTNMWTWLTVATHLILIKPKRYYFSNWLKKLLVLVSAGPAVLVTCIYWAAGFFGRSTYAMCWVSSDPPELIAYVYNVPMMCLALLSTIMVIVNIKLCMDRISLTKSYGKHGRRGSVESQVALKMAMRTLPFTLTLVVMQALSALFDLQDLFDYTLPVIVYNIGMLLPRGTMMALSWAIPTFYLDVYRPWKSKRDEQETAIERLP